MGRMGRSCWLPGPKDMVGCQPSSRTLSPHRGSLQPKARSVLRSRANSLRAGELVAEQMLGGALLNFISNLAFAKICFCQKCQHIAAVHLLKLNAIPGSPGEGHRPLRRLSPNSPQQGGNTAGPTSLGFPRSLLSRTELGLPR